MQDWDCGKQIWSEMEQISATTIKVSRAPQVHLPVTYPFRRRRGWRNQAKAATAIGFCWTTWGAVRVTRFVEEPKTCINCRLSITTWVENNTFLAEFRYLTPN